MNRCRECNAPLKPDERICYGCNAPVVEKDSAQTSFGKKFATLLKIAFFASAALTVASLFAGDYTPSFMRCITATLVLLLAKSSAEQMLERKGG